MMIILIVWCFYIRMTFWGVIVCIVTFHNSNNNNYYYLFIYLFSHLADAFVQSDLQMRIIITLIIKSWEVHIKQV